MVATIASILLSLIVIALSVVLWRRYQRQPPHEQPSTSKAGGGSEAAAETNVRRCPASGAVVGEEVKSDPLMEFAEGDRKSAPVMCPFMAAFKSAKDRSERELNGEDASDCEDPALEQLKEIMEGYQTFRENKEREEAEAKKVADEEKECQPQGEKKDDEVDNYNTMVSHIKRLEQEKMFLQLSQEELEAEEDARKSQLAEIYEMMASQKDKFGIGSVSEVQRQMRLYVR